jgi:hypothetical protein
MSPASGTTEIQLNHEDANLINEWIIQNGLSGGGAWLDEVGHWRFAFEGCILSQTFPLSLLPGRQEASSLLCHMFLLPW